MAYCGAATKGGKIRWGLVALFLLLGVIMVIIYVTSYANCVKDIIKATDEELSCASLTLYRLYCLCLVQVLQQLLVGAHSVRQAPTCL